ncbi:MAG TPA: hypothetical protein VFV57_05935 [Limnobacter sp.]|nr:hypothetical protein [Limnobacter sp.]
MIKLELNVNQVDVLIMALGEIQAKFSHDLILYIQNATKAQLADQPAPAPKPPLESPELTGTDTPKN